MTIKNQLMMQFTLENTNAQVFNLIASNERFYHKPDSERMIGLHKTITSGKEKASFIQEKMKSEKCLNCSNVLTCQTKCY